MYDFIGTLSPNCPHANIFLIGERKLSLFSSWSGGNCAANTGKLIPLFTY